MFSFLTESITQPQLSCWLTETNEPMHELIRANLHRAPMYSGQIQGTGPRYCPSIEDKVVRFKEKPAGDGGMINGGFFVLSPSVLGLIQNDATIWEQEPLNTLAAQGELMAYEHKGFWQPMDTLRDKHLLENLWASGNAPWRKWD
jgi:glucose-1-phosphate cytidylyltransferase